MKEVLQLLESFQASGMMNKEIEKSQKIVLFFQYKELNFLLTAMQ